jgi:hypothetical protein
MCAGDDRNCPEFERHRQKLLDDLDTERRHFLKSAFAATGGAAALTGGGVSLVSPAAGQTAAARQGQPKHHYVPATDTTVHWGYFSKLLKPVVEIDPGDYVSIETLTHHANDDAERMVKGDPGAESVYLWTKDKKGVNRRGAGPLDGKLLGRGAGDLRDRCDRTAQLGEGRVQFSVDPADGPIRGGAQDHRLSGCPCRP